MCVWPPRQNLTCGVTESPWDLSAEDPANADIRSGVSKTLSREEETTKDFKCFLSALMVFQKVINIDMSSPRESIDGLGHAAATLKNKKPSQISVLEYSYPALDVRTTL